MFFLQIPGKTFSSAPNQVVKDMLKGNRHLYVSHNGFDQCLKIKAVTVHPFRVSGSL